MRLCVCRCPLVEQKNHHREYPRPFPFTPCCFLAGHASGRVCTISAASTQALSCLVIVDRQESVGLLRNGPGSSVSYDTRPKEHRQHRTFAHLTWLCAKPQWPPPPSVDQKSHDMRTLHQQHRSETKVWTVDHMFAANPWASFSAWNCKEFWRKARKISRPLALCFEPKEGRKTVVWHEKKWEGKARVSESERERE